MWLVMMRLVLLVYLLTSTNTTNGSDENSDVSERNPRSLGQSAGLMPAPNPLVNIPTESSTPETTTPLRSSSTDVILLLLDNSTTMITPEATNYTNLTTLTVFNTTQEENITTTAIVVTSSISQTTTTAQTTSVVPTTTIEVSTLPTTLSRILLHSFSSTLAPGSTTSKPNNTALDPSAQKSDTKGKENGSNDEDPHVWLYPVVATLIFCVCGFLIGVVLCIMRKKRENRMKRQKHEETNCLDIEPDLPSHRPARARPPQPRMIRSIPLEPSEFARKAPLVMDTGCKYDIKHLTEDDKSKSIKRVIFDKRLNEIAEIGSNIELIPVSQKRSTSKREIKATRTKSTKETAPDTGTEAELPIATTPDSSLREVKVKRN